MNAAEWLSKRGFVAEEVKVGPCYHVRSAHAVWRKYAGELGSGGRYGACTCRGIPKRLIKSMHSLIGGEILEPEAITDEVVF